MRVLGVDPGTHFMGYGVLDVEGDSTACVASGTLDGGGSRETPQRLLRLYEGLAGVIEQWHPEQLAVEEPFVAPERGAKSAVLVGQAQAVALLLAARASMPVHRYTPAEVKSAVAGYGAGSKAQVQRTVRLLLDLGEGEMSDDASDALAVGLCYIQHWRAAERVRLS